MCAAAAVAATVLGGPGWWWWVVPAATAAAGGLLLVALGWRWCRPRPGARHTAVDADDGDPHLRRLADRAVRSVEARYVRPRLVQRLRDAVGRLPPAATIHHPAAPPPPSPHGAGGPAPWGDGGRAAVVASSFLLRQRATLFCHLESDVRLTADEKGLARDLAVDLVLEEWRRRDGDRPEDVVWMDAPEAPRRARAVALVEAAYARRYADGGPAERLVDRLGAFLPHGAETAVLAAPQHHHYGATCHHHHHHDGEADEGDDGRHHHPPRWPTGGAPHHHHRSHPPHHHHHRHRPPRPQPPDHPASAAAPAEMAED